MTKPSVTVLNVGHGLCAVLQDEKGTMMFDVAPGPVPRDFLRTVGVNNLDAIMVSHLHKDHCAGMTGFLGEDYAICELFLNRPRAPETKTYRDIKAAINTLRSVRRGLPRIRSFDTDADRPVLKRGDVEVHVVAPDALEERSLDLVEGGRSSSHTEHSACGVARIDYRGSPRVLLTGDLDRRGLSILVSRTPDALRADVLVYPHHGGTSSHGDEESFARELCSHVQPKLVIFSMGRADGQRPHPAVLKGVATTVATAPGVVCTQLSTRCDGREPDHGARLEPLPIMLSTPREERRLCCGGSIMIPLSSGAATFVGDTDHAAFVGSGAIPTPLCEHIAVGNTAG